MNKPFLYKKKSMNSNSEISQPADVSFGRTYDTIDVGEP